MSQRPDEVSLVHIQISSSDHFREGLNAYWILPVCYHLVAILGQKYKLFTKRQKKAPIILGLTKIMYDQSDYVVVYLFKKRETERRQLWL